MLWPSSRDKSLEYPQPIWQDKTVSTFLPILQFWQNLWWVKTEKNPIFIGYGNPFSQLSTLLGKKLNISLPPTVQVTLMVCKKLWGLMTLFPLKLSVREVDKNEFDFSKNHKYVSDEKKPKRERYPLAFFSKRFVWQPQFVFGR